MFDRFTENARNTMRNSRINAERLNHDYIGTEHIVLGLAGVRTGVAAYVLAKLGVKLDDIRTEVEKRVKPEVQEINAEQLPFTPRGKKVLEFAIDEARGMDHNYVGTEHLLLGLLREREGIAAQALMHLGLNLEDVRKEVIDYLKTQPG